MTRQLSYPCCQPFPTLDKRQHSVDNEKAQPPFGAEFRGFVQGDFSTK
jgi:hypothetical protein